MNVQVLYGKGDTYVDVTRRVAMKCYANGKITLPEQDDIRANILGDPMYGTVKEVIVIEGEKKTVFSAGTCVNYPCTSFIKYSEPNPKGWKNKNLPIDDRIKFIHNELDITGGNIADEYPEQRLVAEFISSSSKVLELGSNIGRNTLMISSHLDDETQLVTLECSSSSVRILKTNRDLNKFKFKIEPSALSARKLYLSGWKSYIEETRPSHAVEVSTITWEKLQSKYSIEFDTLVADCEGALYYILRDTPELLNNIKVIIVENDYFILNDAGIIESYNFPHKAYVESIYRKNDFRLIKQVAGGFGPFYYDFFYEVWVKNS
jgi:FkbM family methyltransferase